ncbi:hypothetical protein [Prochlorothrix hollandica]|uniref:Uncharacterized protein n=1 Tax=Prochlorothrix hollandica PCC 9006 = CALU 1027 TaxID=317619 RepID=A0A0M2PY10_PROHO|nr:hypothetical protein [Prochlorothrix hollandica]KKI99972.1 hypothetical protein PROH_09305 [Prochlorothrix hollandica PCC 9006 = CALU 1027]
MNNLLNVGYKRDLVQRYDQEAQTLANLTGWSLEDIRRKQPTVEVQTQPEELPWWRNLWGSVRTNVNQWWS